MIQLIQTAMQRLAGNTFSMLGFQKMQVLEALKQTALDLLVVAAVGTMIAGMVFSAVKFGEVITLTMLSIIALAILFFGNLRNNGDQNEMVP